MMGKPPTKPLFGEGENGAAIGYMCLVDFECELGNAMGGNTVYPDIDDLREHRRCVDGCGIVKVEVRAIEIVQPENREVMFVKSAK